MYQIPPLRALTAAYKEQDESVKKQVRVEKSEGLVKNEVIFVKDINSF